MQREAVSCSLDCTDDVANVLYRTTVMLAIKMTRMTATKTMTKIKMILTRVKTKMRTITITQTTNKGEKRNSIKITHQ